MNLRTSILRGAVACFATALFASLQAQTLTFTADSWSYEELLTCYVIFDGDTVFGPYNGEQLFPDDTFGDTFEWNFSIFGAGEYTLYMDDDYGDGGTSWAVDAGPFNCFGACSGEVAGFGGAVTFTLTADVPGCTNPDALNYDDTATLDDGSCLLDACPDADLTMVFLTMTDSYGDGWNGETYTLSSSDGTVVATGTLDSSFVSNGGFFGGPATGQDTLCLADGCYSLSYGGGSTSFQLGISLTNVYTNGVIASSTAGGVIDFALGGTCGCTDPSALNYDGTATVDDGTCFYPGCDEGYALVQFTMRDDYGDGWDGTTYTLYDGSGTAVQTGDLGSAVVTVTPGAEGYDFFCLSTTDCYTLFVGGGAWLGEKAWTITDFNTGEILYEETFGEAVGTFSVAGPGVACGCTNPLGYNYDENANTDDGSCFLADCEGNADSTTYLVTLQQTNYLNWANNPLYIYDIETGDTILSAGYVDGQFLPDFIIDPITNIWQFCIPNDACYVLSAGGGSVGYGVNTWTITDFSGENVLHSGGLETIDIGFGSSAGSCVSGCTLPSAINYDPLATVNDNSCVVCDNGAFGLTIETTDAFAQGWNGGSYYLASVETGDTVLIGGMDDGLSIQSSTNCVEVGCYTFSTDALFGSQSWAISDQLGNVYAEATAGTADAFPIALGGTGATDCGFTGCTDPLAINYVLSASVDDESCEYAPANDTPETASAIACGLTLPGTLENATGDEYNGTTILGNSISNNGAIWYEFNADADYQVTFNLCDSQDAENGVTDSDVVVFVEEADGSLTAIATNDDSNVSGCFLNSIVSINAEVGENYFIRVGTWSSTTSTTGIVISATCTTCEGGFPENDDLCTLALPLVNGGNYDGSLCCTGADEDFDMFGLSPFASVYGVWYEVETNTTDNLYSITLDATGDAAAGFALYRGEDCTDLTNLSSGLVSGAVQTDVPGYDYFGMDGPVTFDLVSPNATDNYYVLIWTTTPSDCGDYSISMTSTVQGCTDPIATNYNPDAIVDNGNCAYFGVVQPNDSCSNAIDITCGSVTQGNTGGATAVGGLTPCGNSTAGVWYSLANTGEQLVTLSTCGSTVSTGFEIFQEIDAPQVTLGVNSLNPDNYQNISAVIEYNGQVVATFAAGEVFPTVFNDFFYGLDGGEYTVSFTNEGDVLDGIDLSVLSNDGTVDDFLCSGECSTEPSTCLDLQIISDNYPSETTYDLVDADGNVFLTGGISGGTNNFSVCVPAGTYTFTIYDAANDGICCGFFGNGSYTLSSADGVLASGGEFGSSESTEFTLEAGSPLNLPAGATLSQTFTIFGGTGQCSSLVCLDEGDNTIIGSESCDGGETFQFISDANANFYSILVAANAGFGGPFDLSVTCEDVVYGCMDAAACNYNDMANVDDPNDPCDYVSCLPCTAENFAYCYDNSEEFEILLVNPDGAGIVLIMNNGIEQNGDNTYDDLTIFDGPVATGAPLYDSDNGLGDVNDPGLTIISSNDSILLTFDSDGSVSCATPSLFGDPLSGINIDIYCAPAPVIACGDSTACNYNEGVDIVDNSLCDFGCLGCTNPAATNFDLGATVDDGSCCFGSIVTINMEDSFGDGWNGATYMFISQAGDTIATGGDDFTTGDSQSDEICVPEDGCYTLVVDGGSFPGEVSWSVTGNVFNQTSGTPGTYIIGLGSECTEGCSYPFSPNYADPDTLDLINNDLCDWDAAVYGCTYTDASNFDVNLGANIDDGSCEFNTASPCPTDLNDDGQTTTADLLLFLGAFGTDCIE